MDLSTVDGAAPTARAWFAPGDAVGCRTTFTATANSQITAIGTFSDGSTQILYDQKI